MSEIGRCPKCRWEVGDAVECPRCGVIVAKALELARATETVEVTTTRAGGGRLPTLLLLLALGAVAIFAFGNAGEEEIATEPEVPAVLASEAERLPPAPRAATEPGGDYAPPYESGVYDSATSDAATRATTAERKFTTYDYAWLEGADGFRRGIEQAEREGRPIVMYFYTDWCGYCRQLEDNLLEHAIVEDYTKYLVKIRINPEKGKVERQLAQQYNVRGFPSLFVHETTDAKPVRISRTKGRKLKSPAEFVDTLRRAAKI